MTEPTVRVQASIVTGDIVEYFAGGEFESITISAERAEMISAELTALRERLANNHAAMSIYRRDIAALRERLAELENAAWDVCDGMYGGNAYEPIPIDLLPEDRRELLHTLLEVCGRATADEGDE